MSQMSDYLEVQLRDHLFRTASFTKPAALHVSLHTVSPTDTGSGTEVSGGSYARVARAPADANWSAVSATDGMTKNVAAITFPSPTAGWGTVTHFGIWDASTAGNMICWGALGTAKTVNSGDAAPSYAADAIQIQFGLTGGMSDYLEVQLRAHIFRTASFTKPAALHVSLHTADPTDTGSGTEVSGGSYARVARAPLNANWSAVSATDGITKNIAAITFPSPTAGWGTVTHFGIWDASTAGNLLCYGPLGTAKLINSGDAAPSFAADALVITLQ